MQKSDLELGCREFFKLSFEEREKTILAHFKYFTSLQERYKELMNLRTLAPILPASLLRENTLVRGCQSIMHLQVTLQEGLIHIEIFSESLISLGLATLIFLLFENLPANTPFLCSLHSLSLHLDLPNLLSPGRSNGFVSMLDHLKKQIIQILSSSHADKI